MIQGFLGNTRSQIAVAVGRGTAALSRAVGVGRGTVVGGHAALLVDPTVLKRVVRDHRTILVTGTNGKTTTTTMISAALTTEASVASNAEGANMPAGLVTALLDTPSARYAVLEVDESYLDVVAATVRPDVVVLLNLSREFTRGVSLANVRATIARAVRQLEPTTVLVANCDDPYVVDVVGHQRTVVWVSGGDTRPTGHDLCPRCGRHLMGSHDWHCQGCGLTRPQPSWELAGNTLVHRNQRIPFDELDSASWFRSNATFAAAAVEVLGVPAQVAIDRSQTMGDVDGRYRKYSVEGRSVRVAMWKNPASLEAALGSVLPNEQLILMTDRFGIKDTVSLWEVDVPDRHWPVIVCGGRALDAAARIEAASMAFEVVTDPRDAVLRCDAGHVVVVANYPAHLRFKKLFADEAAA